MTGECAATLLPEYDTTTCSTARRSRCGPRFALFALRSGVMLGLKWRHTVEPAADGVRGGFAERGFPVADPAAVEATHADWCARGLPIAQAPTAMGFGHTFVALDPDGHRRRVFAPT